MRLFFLLLLCGCGLGAAASDTAQYYGRNALSAGFVGTPAGSGAGLEYERAFKHTQAYTWNVRLSFQYRRVEIGYVRNGLLGDYIDKESLDPACLWLLRPGVRRYFPAFNGVIRYAMGLSGWLGVGTGQGSAPYDHKNSIAPRTMIGVVWEHTLHLHLTPHIKLSAALEIGGGHDTTPGFGDFLRVPSFSSFSVLLGYRW